MQKNMYGYYKMNHNFIPNRAQNVPKILQFPPKLTDDKNYKRPPQTYTEKLQNNETAIKQKLENYNAEKMMYKTSITEVDIKSFPVSTYTANISVKRNDDGTATVLWKGAFYRAYVNNDPPPELNEAAAIKTVKEFFQVGLNNLKKKIEK